MNTISMLFPEGRQKALTLSYDDGIEQDIRLLEIMAKYGLKGTFNINSDLYPAEGYQWPEGYLYRRMPKALATEVYTQAKQEVAMHGLTHANLKGLPTELIVSQILKDKDNLEKQFGHIIRGFAYPYGTYSGTVVAALKSCGVAYARTVISTGRFDVPDNWLELPTTCHHNDPNLMQYAKKFVEYVPAWQPLMFYLWGHSYEFEQYDNWQVIENFASYIGGRTEIWYATNIEICDYVKSWHELHFSADGVRVYNPTCNMLWIQAVQHFPLRRTIHRIAPGQEMNLTEA